ncbi:MAG TPA: TatD family hydrolase [Burkholderiaceae bacterium]|nr:TatD family hydrolase [Burkholderiaceae bacterium]
MYVDSHCHLCFPELSQDLPGVLQRMRDNNVVAALNICTTLEEFPAVLAVAEQHSHIVASVGVHPDYQEIEEPTVEKLVALADHPKVVAIGETGLDYFRLREPLEWQRERFRTHLRAARRCGKPLIIHTRASSPDTIRLMKEEGGEQAGGVMHCFTESLAVAEAAMALGFYISFSGIVTFKNARELQDVARAVPLERLLIETDSPYLAPVPYRGKTNEPGFVPKVAEKVAELKNLSVDQVAAASTANFYRLFRCLENVPTHSINATDRSAVAPNQSVAFNS